MIANDCEVPIIYSGISFPDSRFPPKSMMQPKNNTAFAQWLPDARRLVTDAK